jgi:hypothetical protein
MTVNIGALLAQDTFKALTTDLHIAWHFVLTNLWLVLLLICLVIVSIVLRRSAPRRRLARTR